MLNDQKFKIVLTPAYILINHDDNYRHEKLHEKTYYKFGVKKGGEG